MVYGYVIYAAGSGSDHLDFNSYFVKVSGKLSINVCFYSLSCNGDLLEKRNTAYFGLTKAVQKALKLYRVHTA